jgi:uncharacterized membrane protein YfcA
MFIQVAEQLVWLPGLALLGVVVGFVAGMFGVGGGFLLTPLLAVMFDIPMPIAVGTGLCQMIGTATVAFLRHRKLGQGEVRFDLLMIAGAMVGVGAGTATVTSLQSMGSVAVGSGSMPTVTVVLYAAYVVLLAACSWMFWRQAGQRIDGLDEVRTGPLARLKLGPRVALPRIPLQGVSAIAVAYIGMALGFLSGLLGIGGGVALMPVLIYGFGFPIKQAAGTGILVLLITVAVGTVQHALAGNVHLIMAGVLLVGSSISAQFGALITRKLPARTLRRTFALLIWVTVAAICWDVLRVVQGA